MSKISAIDFANNVEYNRKRLIQHCRDNGLKINENEPLDNVVAINGQINISQPVDTFIVEFKDLDGNDFVPPQYVKKGESAVIPEGYPELDSEYLEFVEWAVSGGDDLTNVERDILCLPHYQTKYDEMSGQRPTYLICYFDDGGLSPTLNFYTATNTYIDWGDGTEPISATSSKTHTYANAGWYTIKIYGEKYAIGGNTSYGSFTTATYRYSLRKAYLSENVYTLPSHMFYNCNSLKYIVIPYNIIESLPMGFCSNSACLLSVVLPKGITNTVNNREKGHFAGCQTLKNIIIPQGLKVIGSGMFRGCLSLEKISLPNSVKSLADYAFYQCAKMKSINGIENIENFNNYCLNGCNCVESINLSDNITNINGSAFAECTKLSSVSIPNTVVSIGEYAFSSTMLKEITIPSSVMTIGTGIFNSCYNLKNVILYQDFNISGLSFTYSQLSDTCLVDIANKLKDNSNDTSKTISFGKSFNYLNIKSIYLNEYGERVDEGTDGALSWLEFVQNKNWTVSFSA